MTFEKFYGPLLEHERIEWWFAALMRFQAGEKVKPPPWWAAEESGEDKTEAMFRTFKRLATRSQPKGE